MCDVWNAEQPECDRQADAHGGVETAEQKARDDGLDEEHGRQARALLTLAELVNKGSSSRRKPCSGSCERLRGTAKPGPRRFPQRHWMAVPRTLVAFPASAGMTWCGTGDVNH